MGISESALEKIKKTLQESETRYRLLFENSMDPVFLMEDGRFIDCNKAALEMLHCPHKDQIVGLRPSQISPGKQPDGRLSEEKEKKAIYFADKKRKDQFEWVHQTFDGIDFWVQVSLTIVTVNGKLITHIHWRDVTKQKHMEAEIRESEDRYRSLFDLESDAIFLIDSETGQILEVNNAATSLYGYSKEELLQKKNTDLSAEEQETRKATLKELTVIPLRYHRKKDGTVFPVEITATHLSWKGRRSHLAAIRDITERKKIEDALRKSEGDYRNIYDNAMVGIYQSTPKGRYLRVNPALASIHGFSSPEEMIRTVTSIGEQLYVNSEDRKRYMKLLDRDDMIRGFEAQLYRKDKSNVWISMNVRVIRNPDGSIAYYEGIVEDITLRKQAEEKLHTLLSELESKNKELRKAYEDLKMSEAMLIQSEKMASLGQLSAGIAHELKNPLSIILQGIAYVQSSVEDSTLIDACERIKKSAIRADIVIQNLLSFSRQTPPSFTEADMNILIEEALAMVEHQMNLQNIEIIRNYSHRISAVLADDNQIKQVFINVFINASEAMKGGGAITITTTTGSGKDGEPCVEVAITDTGTGIPEEIINNVLDPFFSTKKGSGGTGLGLSVTKGIIDRHHGSIAISSKEGAGTTVTITLPCNPSKKGNTLDG
ncbi:MAG: PAS domain S-box protein [Syntrophorhabdaceae bacterium]|nr:PAS domain S-box protein [Syntrophorhabdaceae bacterium]